MDGKISNLMHGARLQDYLLQTYRTMHLTSQSILFAIGTGLTIANAKGFENTSDALIVFGLTLLFSILGLVLSTSFKAVTKSREEDVDFWHQKIEQAECELPEEYQFFKAFKQWQKHKGGDTGIRDKLRKKLFVWIPGIWIVIIASSVYFTLPQIIQLFQ